LQQCGLDGYLFYFLLVIFYYYYYFLVLKEKSMMVSMDGLIFVVVAVGGLDLKLEAGGFGVKFAGIDLVWVCWLLVSDSSCDGSKFALISKLMHNLAL
jgi:hypothetical protein